MSFDNLMGYSLSTLVCTQNFITIFHLVQEIAPFSLFQNLELGKATTDENVSSQSLGLDLVNINVNAKVYHFHIPVSTVISLLYVNEYIHVYLYVYTSSYCPCMYFLISRK